MMKTVTFQFDNDAAAEHFLIWLCEQGEQGYWDWMRVQEEEESGPITAIEFDYHGGTREGDEFGKHPIMTTCGRLSAKKR